MIAMLVIETMLMLTIMTMMVMVTVMMNIMTSHHIVIVPEASGASKSFWVTWISAEFERNQLGWSHGETEADLLREMGNRNIFVG